MNSKIPILAFHEIVNDGQIGNLASVIQKKYIVEKSVFEGQLQYLNYSHYICPTISEIITNAQGPQQKICYITFDDGYAGNFDLALPLLKKYGFKATFFIVPNWIGREHMMSWQQIKALIDEGMQIGSHTNNHRLLETCDRETIENELAQSRESIEKYTGYTADIVSYPNGSYSKLVNEIAKNTGYLAALTSDFGYESPENIPFMMKRIFVTNTTESLTKALNAEPKFLFSSYLTGGLKKALKLIFGRARYDRLYNKLFNINIRQ